MAVLDRIEHPQQKAPRFANRLIKYSAQQREMHEIANFIEHQYEDLVGNGLNARQTLFIA